MMRGTAVITVIVLTLVGVGAAYALYEATGTAGFCARCHEMRPVVEAWQQSGHAHLSCFSCHAKDGRFGQFLAHASGLESVARHFTGLYVRPISSEVKDEVCLSCHEKVLDKNSAGDIIMVHGRHEAKNVHCTDCHGRVAHLTPASLEKSPNRQLCVDCHIKKGISVACMLCHRNGPPALEFGRSAEGV